MLSVKDLGCLPFFDSASLELRRGEILGLAGLVGAGRSSLALAIYGRRPAKQGSILLNGKRLQAKEPWQAIESGVGYLTEDRNGEGIFPLLGVGENTLISTLKDFVIRGFLQPQSMQKAAAETAKQFDVRCSGPDQKIGHLSGGNQQKALLGRILRHDLQVLNLDEPTRGVDVGAKAEIYRLIYALAEQGLAVLMISPDLPELLGTCDSILVMSEGRTVGKLSREQATQQNIMELATCQKEAPHHGH